MKLTVIGYGKMATALINGLIDDYEIEVVGRDIYKLNALKDIFPKIETYSIENDSFNIDNKNIILCVKPQVLNEVSKKFNGYAENLFSVLAGTKIGSLKESIKADSYIRFMPNLGATYLKSMTTVTGSENRKELALEIAKSIGNAIWVNSEKELDIATAVAGSGPAYLALVAEALSDGAVKEGLSRDLANDLVAGLFEGFAELIKNTHPAVIKDSVMSPAGTTASGYFELEEGSVRVSFMKAVKGANERAKELRDIK